MRKKEIDIKKLKSKKWSEEVVLHWLIGGTVGAVSGLFYSFSIILKADLSNSGLYDVLNHVCALIILVSVFLGAALGVTFGKIIVLLKEIYAKDKIKTPKTIKIRK